MSENTQGNDKEYLINVKKLINKTADELQAEALAEEGDPEQRCLILMDLLELIKGERGMEISDYKSHWFKTGKPLKRK